MVLIALFTYRLSSQIPSGLFKPLEEGSTQKGGVALSGLLTQPRGLCSLTTPLFCYRGNIPPRICRPLLPSSLPTRS